LVGLTNNLKQQWEKRCLADLYVSLCVLKRHCHSPWLHRWPYDITFLLHQAVLPREGCQVVGVIVRQLCGGVCPAAVPRMVDTQISASSSGDEHSLPHLFCHALLLSLSPPLQNIVSEVFPQQPEQFYITP